MILSGNGISIVRSPGCASSIREGRLVQTLPVYKIPKFELSALIPASRPILPKVRETITLTKQHLADIWAFTTET